MSLSLNIEKSMTSLEIAELVNTRHDVVKKSIERLAGRAVITLPPLMEKPTDGRPSTFYTFSGEQGKLDSITVVAQLSPEFTSALVKRWYELEANQPKELSRMELIQLAMEAEKEKLALQETIQLQAPKVDFYDKLGESETLTTATQVASLFGITARELNERLYELDVYSLNVDIKRGKVFKKWFIDIGYGEMRKGINGVTAPLFTAKGEQWVFDNI